MADEKKQKQKTQQKKHKNTADDWITVPFKQNCRFLSIDYTDLVVTFSPKQQFHG